MANQHLAGAPAAARKVRIIDSPQAQFLTVVAAVCIGVIIGTVTGLLVNLVVGVILSHSCYIAAVVYCGQRFRGESEAPDSVRPLRQLTETTRNSMILFTITALVFMLQGTSATRSGDAYEWVGTAGFAIMAAMYMQSAVFLYSRGR